MFCAVDFIYKYKKIKLCFQLIYHDIHQPLHALKCFIKPDKIIFKISFNVMFIKRGLYLISSLFFLMLPSFIFLLQQIDKHFVNILQKIYLKLYYLHFNAVFL